MRNLVVSIYMRCIEIGDHRMMGAKVLIYIYIYMNEECCGSATEFTPELRGREL